MLKKARKYLIIIVGVIVLIFLLQTIHWLPTFKSIFQSQPVVIDKTPILIKEIHELAQLCTITAYDEVVADSTRITDHTVPVPVVPGMMPMNSFSFPPDRIVIIGKGKLIAGVDLKKLKEENIKIEGDSISLSMPSAEILDVIMNPSDFETFSEDGSWTNEAVTAVKVKARDIIIRRAIQQKIIERASGRSNMLLEIFLRSAGFSKVSVRTI